MKDKADNILYIGKAVVLKNRVSSYFRKTNKTNRILKMVSLIDHFEYIVTDTEAEALILECNLIKEHRPKFNVLLKDDKTYPYIKVDIKSEYPNVFITRRILKDGAKYFGPYPNAGAAKEMVQFIKERFKIRQCKTFKSTTRACLNYHIKRCMAPCINKVSREEYMQEINQILMLLEGKTDKIIKELDDKIKELADKLEFEKAAELRDRKNAILVITEKQKISNINENSIDVIGLYKNDLEVCIEIFFIRNSKMIGREHYFFKRNYYNDDKNIVEEDESKDNEDRDNKFENNKNDSDRAENEEIISSFLKQYYMDLEEIPAKIMVKENISEKEIIEEWLSKKANRKVEIKIPKIGEKLKFIEMAENNAKITLENKHREKYNILQELKEKLNLEKLPIKIESFDISNISGTYIVAGMCVAINGKINKSLSRKFKIKNTFEQNDVACMKEVVERRIKHSINEAEIGSGFGKLPDLILADGGITQIRAIKEIVDKYNLAIPVYGMVKNDKHRTRALLDENRNEIEISEELLNFITTFQDEVHKTAIEYHKKLRDKGMLKSELDDIEGIGPAKKKALMQKFGTVENIKNASVEELVKVKGITEEIAKRLKEN